MSARVPLDVDLEDKLLYGLTPIRFAYIVLAVLAAFSVWSGNWAPTPIRGAAAVVIGFLGACAAWGSWHGRAVDRWVMDVFIFVASNYRVRARRKRR